MDVELPTHIMMMICEYLKDAAWWTRILRRGSDKLTLPLACHVFRDLATGYGDMILGDLLLMLECSQVMSEHMDNPEVAAVLSGRENYRRMFFPSVNEDPDYTPTDCWGLMWIDKSKFNKKAIKNAIDIAGESAIEIPVVWVSRGLISVHDNECEVVAFMRKCLSASFTRTDDKLAWLYLTRDAPLDVVLWTMDILEHSQKDKSEDDPDYQSFVQGALHFAMIRCDVDAVKAILDKVDDIHTFFRTWGPIDIDIDHFAMLGGNVEIWQALCVLFWVEHPKVQDVITLWIDYVVGKNEVFLASLSYYLPSNIHGRPPRRHWRIPPGVDLTPLCEFKLDRLKWWVAQGDLLPQPPLHVMGIFAYRLDSPLEIREWCFNEYKPVNSYQQEYALHYRNKSVIRDYVGESMRTHVFDRTQPTIDPNVALDHFKMMFNESSVFYEMSTHIAVQDWNIQGTMHNNIAAACRKWFYTNVSRRPVSLEKENEISRAGKFLKALASAHLHHPTSRYVSINVPPAVFKRAACDVKLLDCMLRSHSLPNESGWTLQIPKGSWTTETIMLIARMAGYVPNGSKRYPIEDQEVIVPEKIAKQLENLSPDALLTLYKNSEIYREARLPTRKTLPALRFLTFFFEKVNIQDYVETALKEDVHPRTSLLLPLKFGGPKLDLERFMSVARPGIDVPLYLNPKVMVDVILKRKVHNSSFSHYDNWVGVAKFPPKNSALGYLEENNPEAREVLQIWRDIDRHLLDAIEENSRHKRKGLRP